MVSGETLVAGTIGGSLLALNSEGGRIWSWAPPVAEEGGGGLLDCGCTSGGGQFRAGVLYSAPVVADGLVYVGVYDGRAFAIDAATGDDVREYDTGNPIVGGVAVTGDSLFVGASDGNLHAFDLATAEPKQGFPYETEDKVWSTPAVYDGTVYFGSLDHRLYAVDASGGELVWDQPFETGGGIASTPLVVGGTVYVGSFDGNFYAVNASTGEEEWVFAEAADWFWTIAAYYDGIIYACSLDHHVYAIDAGSGEPAWPNPVDIGDEIKSSPVIVGDVLVVASEEGRIYALDLASGAEKWHFDLEVKVLSPLLASEGKVYLNAQDNRLYTFDGATGQPGWSVGLGE